MATFCTAGQETLTEGSLHSAVVITQAKIFWYIFFLILGVTEVGKTYPKSITLSKDALCLSQEHTATESDVW